MNKIILIWLASALLISKKGWTQQLVKLSGQVINPEGEPLEDIFVYLDGHDRLEITDENGKFEFSLPNNTTYSLSFKGLGSTPILKKVTVLGDTNMEVRLSESIQKLEEVVIESEADAFGIRQLRSIEAGGLYEAKKTEVINIKKLIANKATNNARQAYSKIPSLNIWESDCGGLQLDVGGRGLSPRRTSNFNTRQNGYDISADALGYPESYYSPPLQAIDQIEIVRGAGALQYGSQFGGLINFKMKRGAKDKPAHFESENTYGAYNFFNTFNSFHGQDKKINHYSYVQYKRGDCFRCNSAFELFGGYTSMLLEASDKLKVGFDFTGMYYLTQQAGGLTDEQFAEDPEQSTRARNWFRVNWTLPAFTLEYTLSDRVKIYNRTFGLIARRSSLGMLTTPDEGDPEDPEELPTNRDLIDGKFRNIGNETRVSYSYDTKRGLKNSLLVGVRMYRGFTNFSQYLGSAGSEASFERVDTALVSRRKSDFDFPSLNAAIFAEKIIRLSPSLSIVPGFRYEYIQTEAEGTLTTPVPINSFDDVIEQDSSVFNEKNRSIFLYGLGLAKKLRDRYELYANATANYRAINFTDVQIQTNTQFVDPDIQDESGYSFDLGIRRLDFSPFFLEAGLFFLQIDDRIGEVLEDGLRVRTNIGSGRIFGVELFFEADIYKLLDKQSKHKLSLFINGSVNEGKYTKVNDRITADGLRTGNRLEDIPLYNIKTGLTYGFSNFSASLQATFIGEQFSDAQNTRVVITPLQETTGVFGEIPAYHVFDCSAKYVFSKTISLSGSVNNLFNRRYFTRRATAYPGPGIIPAVDRTWNITLSIRL